MADDNESYVNSMKKMLNIFGYEVDTVNSADKEIALAKKGKYDLILTDKDMEDNYKDRGGIHAIKEIRKFNKETPILLNSSALTKEVEQELSSCNKVETCSKTDVVARIKKLLER